MKKNYRQILQKNTTSILLLLWPLGQNLAGAMKKLIYRGMRQLVLSHVICSFTDMMSLAIITINLGQSDVQITI